MAIFYENVPAILFLIGRVAMYRTRDARPQRVAYGAEITAYQQQVPTLEAMLARAPVRVHIVPCPHPVDKEDWMPR